MAKVCLIGGSSEKATGLERYSFGLTRALSRTNGHSFYSTFPEKFEGVTYVGGISPHGANPVLRFINNQVLFPLRIGAYGFDIVHSLTAWFPRLMPNIRRKIITVHDLTPILFPEFHTKKTVWSFRHVISYSVKKADAIVADSFCTKKDLVERLGVDESMISVIHLGVDHERYHPVKDKMRLAQVRSRYRLPEEFILAVGTIEPRKNMLGLAKAYLRAKTAHKLVIAGRRGWMSEPFFRMLESEPELKRDVILLDYVAEEDLPALYGLSQLFVYPSLYEGFGLPPLEAMACGTPVLTSDTSSLPEVVGDAALRVDPYDTDALANAIAKALSEPSLRKRLSRKGIERARAFTWDRSASEVLKVYDKALSR